MRSNFPFSVAMCNDMGSDNVRGVFLRKPLYTSSGHLSNSQRHRMAIENMILDDPVHILLPENQKKCKNYIVRDKTV